MKKVKSPAQQFHAIREFQNLGTLGQVVTRLGQVAGHPTTLPGEATILYEAIDGIKMLINNWKANTEIAKEQFMKGSW
jgi:hypothetical protein